MTPLALVAVAEGFTAAVLALSIFALVADRTLLKRALLREDGSHSAIEASLKLLRDEVRELHEMWMKCGTCKYSAPEDP